MLPPLKKQIFLRGMGGRSLSTLPTIISRWDTQRDRLSLAITRYNNVPCQCPYTLPPWQGKWSLFPTSSNCLYPIQQVRDFGADPAGSTFCSLSGAVGNRGVPVLARKTEFISISSCRDCKGSTEFPVTPFSSPACMHHLYIFTDHIYSANNWPTGICRLLPFKCLQPP